MYSHQSLSAVDLVEVFVTLLCSKQNICNKDTIIYGTWSLHLETIQCLGMFCNITLIIVSKPADVYIVSVQVHYLTNESFTHICMYVGRYIYACKHANLFCYRYNATDL